MMRFYRGISVPQDTADGVIANIRARGLQPRDGRWTMLAADIKPQIEQIWRRPKISTADTRPDASNPSWVCACAEETGALYYACKHNNSGTNDTAILIVFDADPSSAIVDGRDFLYTLFQLGDPRRARPIVERVFGRAVLRYIDRAWSVEGDERIALCDLAVQDDAVVHAHSANKIIIGGRYGTRFRSAFLVRTPVAGDRIVEVRVVKDSFKIPEIDVSLNDLR
jgi:hypothetical protein